MESKNIGPPLEEISHVKGLLLFEKGMRILHKHNISEFYCLKILSQRIDHYGDIIDEGLICTLSTCKYLFENFSMKAKFILCQKCCKSRIFDGGVEEAKSPTILTDIHAIIYGTNLDFYGDEEIDESMNILLADMKEELMNKEKAKRTKEATNDEKIKLFKKACYDTNHITDNDKDNAIIVKLLQHDPEIKKIIQHGTDKKLHKLELVEACANGQFETVQALIDANADINAREHAGKLPEQSKNNQPACRDEDFCDYGPLTVSCLKGHDKIVELLLSKGCDLDKDYNKIISRKPFKMVNLDALHAACRRRGNEKVIDLLMGKRESWNYDRLNNDTSCLYEMVEYSKSKRSNR